MTKFESNVIERVNALTGKLISFRPAEFEVGTLIICDKIEFYLPPSDCAKYFQIAKYYELDIVSHFSSLLIKKFDLEQINENKNE